MSCIKSALVYRCSLKSWMKNGIAIKWFGRVIKQGWRWHCCGKKISKLREGGAKTSGVRFKPKPSCLCQCLSAWPLCTWQQQLLNQTNRAEAMTWGAPEPLYVFTWTPTRLIFLSSKHSRHGTGAAAALCLLASGSLVFIKSSDLLSGHFYRSHFRH